MSLARDVAIVVDQFMIMGSLFIAEGLAAATAFAQAAGAVMGVVKNAVEGIALILTYTGGLSVTTTHTFVSDIRTVDNEFSLAAAMMDTVGMKAAIDFANAAGQVFAFVRDALGVLSTLHDYASPAADKTAKFLEDVKRVIALVSEAVAAMFDIDQGGRFAVVDLYMRGVMAMTLWLQGMIAGVGANAGAVIRAVRDLINAVVNTAETGLGIHSPSQAFTDIGEQTVAGLVDGILARAREAVAAMIDLIDRISGENISDYYTAGHDSALEWLRGWADAMRQAELVPAIPAVMTSGPGGVGGGGSGMINNYNIYVQYRNTQDEGSLRDMIRALQMAGA